MILPEIPITEPSVLHHIAQECRRDVLRMVMASGEGHLGASFSCAEILATLYFSAMQVDPATPRWENRDRFILSKGHACFAHYAMLAYRGYFPTQMLEDIKSPETNFGAHPDRDCVPGVDVSSGSLGHGLPIGCGMALAGKRDGGKYRVFVLMGDGECQEGSVWEAAMFASMNQLDNLLAIIDVNALQAIGETKEIVCIEPLASKWQAFGWQVCDVDGHDCQDLQSVLKAVPATPGKPTVVLARTIKGKGVSFMENSIMWHARAVTEAEYVSAMDELSESLRGQAVS